MTPVTLDESRVAEAGALLARAFHGDPFQSYILPDPEQRRELSVPFFTILVRYGILAGEVWTTKDPMMGVAVWWPPEHADVDPDKLEQSGFNTLGSLIGAEAFDRFNRMLDYIEPLHKAAVPNPHWYTMILGVDPPYQGRGVGRRLLDVIFERADAQAVDCYLETTQPKNVRFYESAGFHMVDHGIEPSSGLSYWTFRRHPPQPRS